MADLNINFRTRITPSHCVLVTRSLSKNAKIVVLKNQPITPTDILGMSSLASGFSGINLAKRLGVNPKSGLKYLKKTLGQVVAPGELIAQKSGLLGKNSIFSPHEGKIDSYDSETGRLLIKMFPKEILVASGVYGIVEDVDHLRGEVIIKTMATEIVGMYGAGMVRCGVLKIINNFDRMTVSSQITSDLRGHIVVSGALIYGSAFRKMMFYGVNGIITGGLNYSDFQSLGGRLTNSSRQPIESDMGLSVLATEGFGSIPIGLDLRQILQKHEGRLVFLEGDNKRLILPENDANVILTVSKIQLPKRSQSVFSEMRRLETLKKGEKVRLVCPPFMGAQGRVIQIDKTPTVLESGLKIYCVIVETDKGKLKVPFTNIELI